MKGLIFLIGLTFLELAYACPGCAGSMDDPNKNRIVYILMIFIALTYIPFYFIYRTIIKNRHVQLNIKNND